MNANTEKKMTVVEEFVCSIDREQKKERITRLVPVFILVLLIAFFTILSPSFLSYSNIIALMNQLSIPLILSCGATFVIIIGSIDLSIEGAMALAGTVLACLIANNTTPYNLGFGAILIALAAGMGVGGISGLLHVKCKVPSFLLTWGISSVCTGLTLLLYRAIPIRIEDTRLLMIAQGTFLGLPILIWIALIIFLICLFIQEYTWIGRYIYAVGADENVPKSAGINTDRVKIIVFVFSGLCIAIAGILGAARLGRGDLQISTSRLFPTITAVVLGGTPLSGGRGSVVNSLLGCLIITVLNNGMIFMGVPNNVVDGIEGIIIITAVTLSANRNRKVVVK